jgi:hypothetical protein
MITGIYRQQRRQYSANPVNSITIQNKESIQKKSSLLKGKFNLNDLLSFLANGYIKEHPTNQLHCTAAELQQQSGTIMIDFTRSTCTM